MKENIRRREAEEKQRKARIAKEKAEREKQERQMKKKRLLEVNTGEMFISHSMKVFTRVSFRKITFEDGWNESLHTFLGACFKQTEKRNKWERVCSVVSLFPCEQPIVVLIPQTQWKFNAMSFMISWRVCEFWIRLICIYSLSIIFTQAFFYPSEHQSHNDVT